jgi:hypothetical protein
MKADQQEAAHKLGLDAQSLKIKRLSPSEYLVIAAARA